MVATGNFNDAWLYLTAPVVEPSCCLLHTGPRGSATSDRQQTTPRGRRHTAE